MNLATMTNEQFLDFLDSRGACRNACHWVEENGGTPTELWKKCTRGDWMLWCLLHLRLVKPADLALYFAEILQNVASKSVHVRRVIHGLKHYNSGGITKAGMLLLADRAFEAAEPQWEGGDYKKEANIVRAAAWAAVTVANPVGRWDLGCSVSIVELADTWRGVERARIRSARILRKHFPDIGTMKVTWRNK